MSNSLGCILTTSASCLAASDLVAEVLEVANNVNSLSSRLGVTDVAVSEEDRAVEVEAIAFKTCNLQRCRRPLFTVKCEVTQGKRSAVMISNEVENELGDLLFTFIWIWLFTVNWPAESLSG